MIVCERCNVLKKVSEFSGSVNSGTGYRSKCKECESDLRAIKKIEFDKLRASDKYSDAFEKASIKKKAVIIVNKAVKDGELTRGLCEVCSTEKNIHGHHGNYSKPLQVNWLCSPHHKQWHRENGEGLNGYDLKQLQIEILKVDFKCLEDECERLRTVNNIYKQEGRGEYKFVHVGVANKMIQKDLGELSEKINEIALALEK